MKAPPVEFVRGWLLLVVGVGLIVDGVIVGQAQTVLLGFSALGVEPLARARAEPPPSSKGDD